MGTVDVLAQSVRLGWTPSYPTFNRNSLDLADEAEASGQPVGDYVVDQLTCGELQFACEDPEAPENWPRVLTLWRANLFGSSGKGNEYFLKHLLGTDNSVRAGEAPRTGVPATSPGPTRRRRASSTCYDDRLPDDQLDAPQRRRAARRHLVREARHHHHRHAPVHPLVQPGHRAAVADEDRLGHLRRPSPRFFAPLAGEHLGVRRDVVAVPLLHDTPDAMATAHGVVKDWKKGECEPVPGVTMPKLVVVERDYGAVAEQMSALGPLLEKLGMITKGITYDVERRGRLPARQERRRAAAVPADGRPRLETDIHVADTILHLSAPPTGTSPPRASRRSRSAPGPSWPTSRPSTRASRSPSPTPRSRRSR